MIYRTKLVFLLALFLAGAVDCLLALLALWLGWDTGALSGAFLVVFACVFFVAAIGGVSPMVYLDVAHQIALDSLALDERRARLQPAAAPAAEPDGGDEPDDAPDLALRWLVACHRWLVAAERHGWQIRRLVGLGIVEWDGWTEITDVLRDAGVIVKTSRTGWAEGWNMEKWQEKKHSLTLPYPQDTEPPTVKNTTTTVTTGQQQAREVVVNGEKG